MNTVFILIALVYSGHFTNSIVPTLEFTSMERCRAAIVTFVAESDGKTGTSNLRCVKIEK